MQLLRNPWIVSFLTAQRTPRGAPRAQVVRNSSQGTSHVVLLSDRFHLVHAHISDAAYAKYREATSASLQGALIQLKAYRAVPCAQFRSMLLLIDEFECIGSEGCDTFGEPTASSLDPAVTALLDRLRREHATLTYNDCVIPAADAAVLEAAAQGDASPDSDDLPRSLRSTPLTAQSEFNTLEDFHADLTGLPVFEELDSQASRGVFTQCFDAAPVPATSLQHATESSAPAPAPPPAPLEPQPQPPASREALLACRRHAAQYFADLRARRATV